MGLRKGEIAMTEQQIILSAVQVVTGSGLENLISLCQAGAQGRKPAREKSESKLKNPMHRTSSITAKSTRFGQLVLRATAEEFISLSKGAALLNVPLQQFREKISGFA